MNKKAILTLVTESPLHPGIGQNVGAIDLPIQRERHTQFPYLPSSSLKGALRSTLPLDEKIKEAIFGADLRSSSHFAGAISFSDMKLLAFPVRTLTGIFRWVTSPIIINRLQRDLDLLGIEWTNQISLNMKNTEVMVSESYTGPDKIIIEDLMLDVKKNPLIDVVSNLIASICLTKDVQKASNEKLKKDLFILNESTFAYLLQYSTEVVARNVLDEEKKTSNNLWSVEIIPRDTLFYSLIIVSEGKSEEAFDTDTLLNEFSDKVSDTYIQFGGYETIGYGWCATDFITQDMLRDIL